VIVSCAKAALFW